MNYWLNGIRLREAGGEHYDGAVRRNRLQTYLTGYRCSMQSVTSNVHDAPMTLSEYDSHLTQRPPRWMVPRMCGFCNYALVSPSPTPVGPYKPDLGVVLGEDRKVI